jgi:translocation protein SEC63
VLADAKSERLVVPPQKVSDVPLFDPTRSRNYRSYKLKFQAPPGTGLFTWRVIVVSDTYIGEDAAKDLQVRFLFVMSRVCGR